jgi:hypothetical protein
VAHWPAEPSNGGQLQKSGGTTWVALVDGVDWLGVLRIDGRDVTDVSEWAEDLAGVLAQLLVTKGAYTDVFARTSRTYEMSRAAGMLWGLIPPITVMTPRVSVAGDLEPASCSLCVDPRAVMPWER